MVDPRVENVTGSNPFLDVLQMNKIYQALHTILIRSISSLVLVFFWGFVDKNVEYHQLHIKSCCSHHLVINERFVHILCNTAAHVAHRCDTTSQLAVISSTNRFEPFNPQRSALQCLSSITRLSVELLFKVRLWSTNMKKDTHTCAGCSASSNNTAL